MLFRNNTSHQGEIGQYCVENPIRQITWRGPQNDVRFSTYALLSSFTFLINKSFKIRCAKRVSGGCLHTGWEPRNFICNMNFKIQIVDKSDFISNIVKDISYYDVMHLRSDLSFLDETIKTIFLEIFDCFEVDYRDFKENSKMQKYICNQIIILSENMLKEKGLELILLNIDELQLLEKGYDSFGKYAGYGVYNSCSEALSSDITNIDNGTTVEDTLRQLLDAGLITQKMFDEKIKKI